MNEELKILITAVSSSATKAIKEVRAELDKVDKTATQNGKSISESMKSVAKGAAIATAAIATITAAVVAFAKSAQDASKGLEKLNTAFESVGSSSSQAQSTYKELYGILGDHDRAVETAQSLSRITTEAGKLNDYYNILAGSAAKYGEGISPETLSENISETIAQGKVVGELSRILVEAGYSEDAFNNALANNLSLSEREVLVRNTLNQALGGAGAAYMVANQATIQYNKSQAELNVALSNAAKYTTPLLTSLNSLGTTLLTFLAPAIQVVATYMTAFIQLIAEAIQWVGGFFGLFSTKGEQATSDVDGYRNAVNNYLSSLNRGFKKTENGIDDNIDSLKELKKQTMGFDELNVISKPTAVASVSTGAAADVVGGAAITPPNPADYGIGTSGLDFTDMLEDIEEAKEKIKGLLVLASGVAVAIGLWKLTDFIDKLKSSKQLIELIKELTRKYGEEEIEKIFGKKGQQVIDEVNEKYGNIGDKLKKIGGIALTVAGTMALIYGYTDAWANGIDWGNLAFMIGGAAAAVGGLYLAFGPLAAAIGLGAAAIGLFVLGVKDFINNGPSTENTLLIIGAAAATAIALATGGLSVLTSIIAGVVAGVAAFTIAILEEEPAIMSTEEAQLALNEAKEKAAEAEMGYINAIDAAEASLKRLEEAEKAAGITGAELYEQVQNGTLDYADMTDAQREVYKAYLDNEKKQADLVKATEELAEAKRNETIASFENQLALAKESGNYDDYKKAVIKAYEEGTLSAEDARDLIGKSMSEMSDDAQQTFMKDIPKDIKNGLDPSKYETTRKKIGDFFVNTFEDLKTEAAKIGPFFKDKVWKPITNWFNSTIKPIFTKAYWSEKFNAIKEGGKAALNGLLGFVESACNWIVSKINSLSFDVPDWVPVIGGSSFGFDLRYISIPRLAEGGIATSSILANIGERGKEAVLPLDRNTEWMDALADRIAARNSAPSKIVLKIGERELGWASIDAINRITKQTGVLQLTT